MGATSFASARNARHAARSISSTTTRFHGWNGYVCGSEEEREHPRPPWLEWHCPTCDGAPHKITLTIQGEDAKSTIPESDGILTSANWHEGFSFLSVDLTCTACKKGPMEVVSLETM